MSAAWMPTRWCSPATLDRVARCRASCGPVRVGECVQLALVRCVAEAKVSRVMEICKNAMGFAEQGGGWAAYTAAEHGNRVSDVRSSDR